MEGTLAIILIFGIPIVAILTSHFRRMKELEISRGVLPSNQDEIAAIRRELAELRERVNDQTLVVEGMRDLVRREAASMRQASPTSDQIHLNQ